MYKICLDAGHYGKYNQSPANKKYYESEAMWDLHLFLKAELEKRGVRVITTRKNQVSDLELTRRGRTAEGCDLFISLHSNAVGNNARNDNVDYVCAIVFSQDDDTKIDEISRKFGQNMVKIVEKLMCTSQNAKLFTKKSSNDRNGDGLYNDEWYGVLQGAKSVGTPAILLEHSFHSNVKMADWLLDVSNLKKLAEAEADCIYDFLKNNMKNDPPSPFFKSYKVKVIDPDPKGLNIRCMPDIRSDIIGTAKKGQMFTVVNEKKDPIKNISWGKLSSGAGYISLNKKYVERID